jgi:hypothetical protein
VPTEKLLRGCGDDAEDVTKAFKWSIPPFLILLNQSK